MVPLCFLVAYPCGAVNEQVGCLHRALYTFTVLGQLEAYNEYYCNKRRTALYTIVEGASQAAARFGLALVSE